MTDDIRIEADGPWTISVNGVEVASSEDEPYPDEWPGPIDPTKFWAMEVTDPTDPLTNGGKRSGCRRIGIDASVVEPEGYELWATSSQFDGGSLDGAVRLAPGQTKSYQNAVETGEKRYQTLWWRDQETLEYTWALPPSGMSGTNNGEVESLPVTPITDAPNSGQIVITIQGLEDNSGPTPPPTFDWPVIPAEYVDTALGFGQAKYGNKSNSSFNLNNKGTAILAPLYAYLGGDRRDKVVNNVLTMLGNFTSPDKGPCGMNGPGAAQECYALTFFHMLRVSDLWNSGVTDQQKRRINAIFHALALIRAWEGNDSSASSGSWTITGMKGTDFKGIGPNIAYAIPAQLTLCAEWFGYEEIDTWLNKTSVAEVRSEVKDALGAGSNLYLTLNWRNAGISAADEGQFYRSGPSSDAPTDNQINASLKNLLYYGAPITDVARFIMPNDSRGLNRALPPTKRTMGANKWVGNNQSALNDGEGVQVSGKKRGYCINNASATPHVPGEGCMIYEINGQDEGGLRSAMGYAFWTVYLVNTQFIVLAMNKNPALDDDAVADFVSRWGMAYDIIRHFDQNDYNSVCHISNKGGTGGPGPVIWSDGRDAWASEVNLWLWETIVTMSV